MDFYVTVSNGPTPNLPGNQTAMSEFDLKEPIELVGQYEVALVQSVFKDVFSGSLATINILPPGTEMEMHRFEMVANDGDDAETIINNINYKMFLAYNLSSTPYFKLDKDTLEFKLELPEGWHQLTIDVNTNYLSQSLQNLKFKSNKFQRQRHFYVFSDLINDQITGSTCHPLLTNFCLSETNSNVVAYLENSPRYVKVKKNSIKNFNIEYSSSIYEATQLSGEIISTLHFRKINGF